MKEEISCPECGGSGREYRTVETPCCNNPKCEACGGLGTRYTGVDVGTCLLCNGKGKITV